MSMARGCSKASRISRSVMALKTTRLAESTSWLSASAKCQEMASPSRSRSVANQTVLAALAFFRSSVMVFLLSLITS